MNSNYQPPILNIATHFSFSVAILFIFAGYTLEYPLLRDIGWIIILAVIVMCAARILLLLPAKVDLKISNITECILVFLLDEGMVASVGATFLYSLYISYACTL